MGVKDIRIADYDYPLPQERIASHPTLRRDDCLLLVSDGHDICDTVFGRLPELLPKGALMVCNNTRVINARMHFRRATGALIEVFLLEPRSPRDYAESFSARGACTWCCLVGNLRRWKSGETLQRTLTLASGRIITLSAERGDPLPGGAHEVTFRWDDAHATFADVIDAVGRIPIPPYLCRDTEDCDSTDYQTVYSKIRGSVAAPTAGLHFTDRVLDDLAAAGIDRRELTLHVGAGTFQPVKSEDIGGHPMHTEVFTVSLPLLADLIAALQSGRPVVAVGTTSVRTLESLPYLGHAVSEGRTLHVDQWEAYSAADFDTVGALKALRRHMEAEGLQTLTASTAIMIAPGFRWRITSAMVTNFHQPESTLLLLVSSFLGTDAAGAPLWRKVYDHALAGPYRFLSYGDACLFTHPKAL